MTLSLDAYARRARFQPALLVALPIALATFTWFPSELAGWRALWGLVVWSGGTALLAQIGRDWGKKKEQDLFLAWSGKPTTRLLRHRDAPNKVILARRHKRLKELIPDLRLPTPEEEQANPSAADEVYESCADFLREKTRDKKRFPLVFEENCNYGFRRNLWGMKPLGITMAALGTVAVAGLVVMNHLAKDISTSPIVFACGLGNFLLLLGWLLCFTPDWVRTTADAYAERLLASSENL